MPTSSQSQKGKASSPAGLRGLMREYRHAIVILTLLAALLVALNAWLRPVGEVVDTAVPAPVLTERPLALPDDVAVKSDAPLAAAAQEAEPVDAAEPAPEMAAPCADPPVDEYFSLPPARAPYALLAVDTEKTPAIAYLQAARGESVLALSVGAPLPDRRILAWAGAEGIIVCDNGRFQRVDHPQEPRDTLTGEWMLQVWVDGSSQDKFATGLVEAADGLFTIPNPYSNERVQGRRRGTRLEASAHEEHRHVLPDLGELVGITTIELGGNTNAELTRMEMSGALTMSRTAPGQERRESRSAMVIVAERVTALETAREHYHESLRQQGMATVRTVSNYLTGFVEEFARLPDSLEELLAIAEAHSPALRRELEEKLEHYTPVPFPRTPVKEFPYPLLLDDPDALYRHELDMAAHYGAESPLPVTVLSLRLTETGEHLGIGVTPFGHFHTWRRPVLEPQSESEWQEIRVQSQNHLKQLGLVIKMFENEHHEFTPGGWWSVYPEYLVDLRILTHPLDEPGTLSYEYLTPATNFRRLMEQTYTAEALENPAALALFMSEQPMMVERRPYGEPPGRNVLFADGHVEWMPEREYQRRAREWFR